MKNRQILLIGIVLTAFLLNACGATGIGTSSAPKLDVKIGGKDAPVAEAKTSIADSTVMTYTEAPRGDGVIRSKKGTSYSILITNFDIQPLDLLKTRTVTADGQTFVRLNFIGEEGTDEKTPVKVGTYTTKAEQFNKFDGAIVSTFSDGKAVQTILLSPQKKADGEVKITSVTTDEVSGEVNLTEGDNSIKGTFKSKIYKR